MVNSSFIVSLPFPMADLTSPEEWAYRPPQSGDHIRVSRGMYDHHGIYVSEEEVIHFSSEDDDNILGSNNRVLSTDIKGFLRGGKLEIKVYTDDERVFLYPVTEIINWARACLGDEGYNLIFNNCQHFTNYCTLGKHHSEQVSQVLGGRRNGMGLWDRLKGSWDGFWGNGGSSRSSISTTTTYEPDKVRVAEIEYNTKIKLAGMEQDRIKLHIDTQMELAEFNARMEAALIEARARGEQTTQQSILDMMRGANILAEQRLRLIETAGIDIVKQINEYYIQLDDEITKDDFKMMDRKRLLLHTLNEFEIDSKEQNFYFQEIQDLCRRHNEFVTLRMKYLQDRQSLLLMSCIASKEQLTSHINILVEKRIEQIGSSAQARIQSELSQEQTSSETVCQYQIATSNSSGSK